MKRSGVTQATTLGRNDPCWCGSGAKYKKCHLNRHEVPAATKQEVLGEFRDLRNKKYCLHPQSSDTNCKGDIVRAHTIQRNGGLSKISENGHVMSLQLDMSAPPGNPTLLEPELIGVRKASTFTGFCNLHDTKIFEPIEKHPFEPTEQHAFLLGYRALARESFAKRGQHEGLQLMKSLDRGKPLQEQIELQAFMTVHGEGVKAGLRDAEHHKRIFDEMLLSGDYSNARFYIVSFDRTPDIMCSAGKFVSHDFSGNVLQDLSQLDAILDQITFTLIATDTGGSAVFSWIGASDPCDRFIHSLESIVDEELPHAIVRFAFEFFENTYFSPSWWEGLSKETKSSLQMRKSLAADPTALRRDDCLVDDGIRAVSWVVTSRHAH